MKFAIKHPRGAEGNSLLIVLCSAAVCMLLLTSTVNRSITTAALNDRNNQYTAGLYAAEAATEKVVARMKSDFLLGDLTYITNNLPVYRASIPTAAEDPYWGNFVFSDAQGHNNSLYVSCLTSMIYTNLESQYAGLYGWQTKYRVLANTQDSSSRYRIVNAVQQDIELDSIPVFQFAIFYNGLLEFTWAATLTVNGRAHSNSNIFVGSASDLTFNSTLTSVGVVAKTNWGGHTTSEFKGRINYNGNPGYSTNCQVLQLPIGTNNTADAVREIIQMPPGAQLGCPPTDEDVNSAMGKERFYNKAEIVLLVSNNAVNVTLKSSPGDLSPAIMTVNYTNNYTAVVSNFPFLDLASSFTDQRENKVILPTDIDITKLRTWISTNASVNAKFPNSSGVYYAGIYPNVMYAADFRTNAATQLTAIRLRNGTTIPANVAPSGQPTGFTVATPNPLYVIGHYNCPNSSHLGTTNTTATYPASLVSDALTILSSQWNDSKSAGSFTTRDAVSTTINAAILTGTVYSTSGDDDGGFSGGVVNLPRLLEDWGNGSSSIKLTLNSSIVNFFNSVRSTNQFQNPGVYYYAPVRQFSFDQNFRSYAKLPPGTPTLGTVFRSKWTTPPAGKVDYAGP